MSLGSSDKHISTDVLVIGGGMAGCFTAVKAKEQGLDVTLVDKACVGRSGSTHYSEGDITFFDAEKGHKLDDWLDGGSKRSEYLNNREWGEILLKEARERYKDLVSWGVKFYYDEDGKIALHPWSQLCPPWRAGSYGPNLLVSQVNREYAPSLRKKALESGVRVVDRIMVCELLKQDGKIVGAVGIHTTSGKLYIFKARATVIASGSSSFKAENRPTHYWTSDGAAMAYRAGTEVTGYEFWTRGLWVNRDEFKKREEAGKMPVDVEKVVDVLARFPCFRGDGGGTGDGGSWAAINAEGGSVISPIWEAHCGRAPVYMDLDALTPYERECTQHYYQRLKTTEIDKVGFDPFKGGLLEFSAGGIVSMLINGGGNGIWPINTSCATALPGLYAAGNSCATRAGGGAGYAGGGWGLIHATVTGTRAALAAAEYASKSKEITIDEAELTRVKKIICAPVERKGGFSPGWLKQIIQSITVPYFFLWIKHGERLEAALTLAEFLNNHLVPKVKAKDAHEWRMALETKNMALSAEMMLRASLFRTESRGSHFREDYPRRDDPTWLAWVKLKEEQGKMKVSKEPVPEEWWPDLSKPYEERYPAMFPGE